MFVADCTAALALTLAVSEWEARLWEMQGPDRWAGTLTRDLAHWAESGVETAADLAALLDAEAERESAKDALYFYEQEQYERWEQERREWEEQRAVEELAERREAEEAARFAMWDYEVDDHGRVRFAA